MKNERKMCRNSISTWPQLAVSAGLSAIIGIAGLAQGQVDQIGENIPKLRSDLAEIVRTAEAAGIDHQFSLRADKIAQISRFSHFE